MAALIISGEVIFALPFHISRFFRPSLLRVFDLSHAELGAMQSVFGVVAMLAYFPGGALADLFSARKLLTTALLTTALSGPVFASLPGARGLWCLHAFWGLSTILLFWGALIRAARDWGNEQKQSSAYGWLDGGRGLVAALLATFGVAVFSSSSPDVAAWTPEQRAAQLQMVIYSYTGVTVAVAAFVWWALNEPVGTASPTRRVSLRKRDIVDVLRRPAVWWQAGVIVCAYTAYKGIDNYSIYAMDVYGVDELEASTLATLAVWVRPVAAVAAGFIGDRHQVSRLLGVCFGLLAVLYAVMANASPEWGAVWGLVATAVSTGALVYALRAVYFALFQEAHIPMRLTGTATGVTSLLGFTPDVFFPPLGGYLLDAAPGPLGHQAYFLLLACFAVAGVGACFGFRHAVYSRAA